MQCLRTLQIPVGEDKVDHRAPDANVVEPLQIDIVDIDVRAVEQNPPGKNEWNCQANDDVDRLDHFGKNGGVIDGLVTLRCGLLRMKFGDSLLEHPFRLLALGIAFSSTVFLRQHDIGGDRDEPGRQEQVVERNDVERAQTKTKNQRDRPCADRRDAVLQALETSPIAGKSDSREDMVFGEDDTAHRHENEAGIGQEGEHALVNEWKGTRDHDRQSNEQGYLRPGHVGKYGLRG
ncbi:hypothetical protein NTGM5_260061 [Candidatus Nitrotoga sp. M5]|nr:hypothetical protein NTGM5_260061 [Candidatus Nitrotoga sp. M5]